MSSPTFLTLLPRQITYDYDTLTLFNEPILLVLAYFIVFVLVIAFRRMDFSITVCVCLCACVCLCGLRVCVRAWERLVY